MHTEPLANLGSICLLRMELQVDVLEAIPTSFDLSYMRSHQDGSKFVTIQKKSGTYMHVCYYSKTISQVVGN